MGNGTPVLIYLKTRHNQDGETVEYEKEFQGQIFQMGSSLYLRYNEETDEQSTVTFKVFENGNVQLTRKNEDLRMQLFFGDNRRISATYRTPYGDIPIETVTPDLTVRLSEAPLAGKINIDYLLYSGGQLLGEYKIRLHFTT
ncbi:DUF1934 domain-containing protein [Liquorilactobacillus satsumensis]|nr:DUF1934 domain-containing protein [Liquorilactobacillus satsumensis]MCP9313310.1 DUF1934 domain-containing protein [Liquorilactobacillus satsumensis]MCP9329570.1 DUF1934 domain-containing protein [Liquorilactobacillus satsumensis]MCP9358145.1 DUF1934 domain-containing protein [Liquorilactobacillus satsumensis]MCP9360440.1 DUF1934 domain-containing protein [Liquorilactobacillus satsumensis]